MGTAKRKPAPLLLSVYPQPTASLPAASPARLARATQDNHLKRGFFVSDCVPFMQGMGDATIPFTITSPPYDNLRDYQGYQFDFPAIAQQLYRITAEGGVVVWVVGDKIKNGRSLTSFRQALFFQDIGFRMHDVMIYQKKEHAVYALKCVYELLRIYVRAIQRFTGGV